MLAAEPLPPIVPQRMREALYSVDDEAMPREFAGQVGRWLHDNRTKFGQIGDPEGRYQFGYALPAVDDHADMLGPLRARIMEAVADEAKLDAICVPAFDARHVEVDAALYHHGGHHDWHDSAAAWDGTIVESRRVAFCYWLASDPQMFEGGELEFLDGSTIEPHNNRLAIWHPIQQTRIRRVECWSSSFLHGRWALTGFVHGDPPEGYVERIPKMRGVPVR
jgi:hypothetical protein